MNKRILKKLSKRAAPLLIAMGDTTQQFPAERDDNYTTSYGHDRKHWDRHRALYPLDRSDDIHVQPRKDAGVIVLNASYMHPWPGTVMLGWMVGYYEPEWEEDDAWSVLKGRVRDAYMEMREIPGTEDELDCPSIEWLCLRRLRNPSQILRAVPELIEQHQKEQRDRERSMAEYKRAAMAAKEARRE